MCLSVLADSLRTDGFCRAARVEYRIALGWSPVHPYAWVIPPQPGSQIAGAHLRHREISPRLEGCLFLTYTQKPLINTKAYGIIVGVPGRLLEITLRTACRSSMAPFPPRVTRCVSSMPLNAHEWAADSLIALLCVSLDRERSVPLTESIGKARPLHADRRSLTVVFTHLTWN